MLLKLIAAGHAFTTDRDADTVSRVDPDRVEVIGEIETGDGPRTVGRFVQVSSGGEVPCGENHHVD